jgi:hypothetical protein
MRLRKEAPARVGSPRARPRTAHRGARHVGCSPAGVARSLLLASSLACLLGCVPNDLRWQVERADQVALQAVPPKPGPVSAYDLDRAEDVLPAGAGARDAFAPYRAGTVLARRNDDGTIDLVTTQRAWRLVEADGTITSLRAEAHELPASGTAWAFLGAAPKGWGRSPWQLRLATPRENVRDARLLVRRSPGFGGALLGFAALAAGIGSAALYLGGRAEAAGPGRAVPLTLGVLDLSGAVVAVGFGLHALLLHEHDEVLVSPVLYPR